MLRQEKGQPIRIKDFQKLDSDWSKSLTLYDTYIGYDRLLATFCGNDLDGKTIFTDFERIIMVFESDGLTEKPGFYANVEQHRALEM